MDSSSKYRTEDGSSAIENMIIWDTALDYGACWIQENIRPQKTEFKLLINITETLNLLAILTVYIAIEWPTKDEKSLKEVLHWETF
ncbi:MAG: hypothetical protein SVP52_04375 [Chloroflexota bacterium]|nr:hypothetical protein [Chloroflexota bacterium]